MEQIGSSSLSQLSGADRAIEAALAEHDTAECNCSTDGYCKGGTEMGTISRSIATPSATIRRAYKKKSIETAEGNNGTGEKEALQEGSGKRGKWQFGNGGAAEWVCRVIVGSSNYFFSNKIFFRPYKKILDLGNFSKFLCFRSMKLNFDLFFGVLVLVLEN
jgi:hypothetical protein